jgi:hemolysin-activating ACP:hemolysin acyltransferase
MELFANKGEKAKQTFQNKAENSDTQTTNTLPVKKTVDAPRCPLADPSVMAAGSEKILVDNRVTEARFTVYGKILSILGRQKPFAEMRLGQIAAMIGPAVDAGLFAIADGQPKDESGPAIPIAFVIWARVSEEIDKKLSESLEGTVALTPQEWTSGNIHWLMLSVGPQHPIDAILKTVSQELPTGQSFKMRFTDKDGQQKVGFFSVEE